MDDTNPTNVSHYYKMDMTNPTGTSGRQGGNSDSDLNRPKRNDDEESGIGNRNTNR